MTILAFEESTDDLQTATQFVAAGSTVNLLPAGNNQVVVVDTNTAPTRQIDIDGTLEDFVDLTVGLPTEIGQSIEVVRNGAVKLSVRIQTEGDTPPYAVNMHENHRSTRYIAETLTEWVEIINDGAGSSGGLGGGTGDVTQTQLANANDNILINGGTF